MILSETISKAPNDAKIYKIRKVNQYKRIAVPTTNIANIDIRTAPNTDTEVNKAAWIGQCAHCNKKYFGETEEKVLDLIANSNHFPCNRFSKFQGMEGAFSNNHW